MQCSQQQYLQQPKVKGGTEEKHTGYILKAMSAFLACHVSFIRHATGLCKLVVYREQLPFLWQRLWSTISKGEWCPREYRVHGEHCIQGSTISLPLSLMSPSIGHGFIFIEL